MRRRKKIEENKICVYTQVRHFSCISPIDAHIRFAQQQLRRKLVGGEKELNIVAPPSAPIEDGHGLVDLELRRGVEKEEGEKERERERGDEKRREKENEDDDDDEDTKKEVQQ